jgi:hypothetical protein
MYTKLLIHETGLSQHSFWLLLDGLYQHIHTYIHACIPWIHKCVTQTAGYGTSHRYIKIKIYSANYYKHFTKTVLQICFTH